MRMEADPDGVDRDAYANGYGSVSLSAPVECEADNDTAVLTVRLR